MKILVSALEHSANIHLAALKKELSDTTELVGIFDRKLGTPIVDLNALAVMGLVDALKKLRFFFKLADEMVELAADADKVLLMDSSGFNLPLAKKLKKRYPDKTIVYYILPQAWAWRRGRIKKIERYVDVMASILPFEKSLYSPGAAIEYVGHPLLDEIPRYKEGVTRHGRTLFMPGSRRGEITRLMPLFHEIRGRIEGEALLAIPPFFDAQQIAQLYGDVSAFTVVHDPYEAMASSDFGFICSGTATLEACLIGLPFILAYKARGLDYAIGSRLVRLPHVGLGNIMFKYHCGRTLHPEFVQDDATVEHLMQAYEGYDREGFFRDSRELRGYLGHGSSQRVARILEG